ncbi:Fe2+-dependent dioxygenase [Novosphingobium terrae]|uniref:Fe2+-dependent dioxygenase n=1 Tax=Novosphingobium terrae TaxID=2726189 RepID=UPI00197FEDC2|nr:Fe2+-dependent dioxygenase [Novosphingobium terrae]
MLLEIPDVFTREEAAAMHEALCQADWLDGKVTAGAQSAKAKRNRQLAESHPLAHDLGQRILERLATNAVFMAAALPEKIYPPLFNSYEPGHDFGDHIDNAIRPINGTRERVRTDLSATLFLAEPDSYDGGELVMRTGFGTQAVKLAAGSLLLYPGTSIHRVEPVTRGRRIASFFWVQSLIRDDGQREMLLDLDMAIQRLTQTGAEQNALIQITGVYHNLLRRWADL